MIGIYKITNKINGKSYIGQSTDINKRFKQHIKSKSKLPLYYSFKKYGINNFTFEIIHICLVNELNMYERYYQEYFNTLTPIGYNMELNNDDDNLKIRAKETKLKIVKSKIDNNILKLEKEWSRKTKIKYDSEEYYEINNVFKRNCWVDNDD